MDSNFNKEAIYFRAWFHINLKNYSKFEVGFTSSGLQIWCIRHNMNVCHVNFGGKKLFADFRCLELKYNKN